MLSYSVEPLTDALIAETVPMQDEYWREVAEPFHKFQPDVKWEMYRDIQEAGNLRILTARTKLGELAGGAFIVLSPHPHYDCTVASLPLFFLTSSCRRGMEGLIFLRRVEKTARSAGAQLIMTHGGIHNGVHRLFEARKYSDFGRYFVKVLED